MVEIKDGMVSEVGSAFLCQNCFHFKTVTVTTYNIQTFFFQNYKPLQTKLFNYGQVKVWFCKVGKLPRVVYTNKEYAFSLTNLVCSAREE